MGAAKAGSAGEGNEAFAGEGFYRDFEIGDGGVEVLGVARVEEPDRSGCGSRIGGGCTKDAGEPEGLRGEEGTALGLS